MTDKVEQVPQKLDRRVVRTQSALWAALLTLLQSESWDQINVRMICDKANVARSSFYLHFQNKQELLDFGFVVGAEETRKQVRLQQSGKLFGTLVWLAAHVGSNGDFFKKASVENSPIQRRFQKTVNTLFTEELDFRNLSVPEATVTFIIGGVFALLADWITNGLNENREVFVGRLQKLTDKVIHELAEEDH